MIKLSHNLPDEFVERVRTLEVKLDIAIQEIVKSNLAIEQHKTETKRLRQVIGLLSSWPGGARTFLVILAMIVFINSLAIEILLKTTDFHVKIKRQLVEFLATDK